MFVSDLLNATSLDTLRDRIALANDRTILRAACAIATEIDGCEYMGTRVSPWDTDRFELLDRALRQRGTYNSV